MRALYNGGMDLSRRRLAQVLMASAATPAVATPQAGADEETSSAHEALRTAVEQLAKVDLPMATEPAVHFKA